MTHFFPRVRRIALAVALASAAVLAHASEHTPASSVERDIRIGSKVLRYVAETDRLPLVHAADDSVRARIFHAAYRSPAGWGQRPITFLWNGGPVSNSALLHFDAFGPRRIVDGTVQDNPHTLLTDSDLVFMDPVGTGYSRAGAPEYQEEFAGTLGDFTAATAFVRDFLITHGATQVPVYLAGESYGVWRAAAVAGMLAERGVQVAGIMLISGGSGTSDLLPELDTAAYQIPIRAVVAKRHGKLAWAKGQDDARVHAQAMTWAQSRYLPALKQRDTLTQTQRDALRGELAHWIGVDADKIDAASLMVSNRSFLAEASPQAGTPLVIFDMRRTEAVPSPSASAITHYFRNELGYRATQPYLGSEAPDLGYLRWDEKSPLPIGARWRYDSAPLTKEAMDKAMAGGGPPGTQPWAIAATQANPALRVFVAAGRYDALNNCDANQAMTERLPVQVRPRFELGCYEGGHMMYHDVDTHARIADDLRRFIRKGTP